MSLLARLRSFTVKIGRVETLFLVSLAVVLAARLFFPRSAVLPLLFLLACFFGAWAAIRQARRLVRRAIWRLRNRLIVAYVFIAVIPLALILILAGLGAWIGTTQVAVYLVSSELDRRTHSLRSAAQWLVDLPAAEREDSVRRMGPSYSGRFPGLIVHIRDSRGGRSLPPGASLGQPSPWGDAHGVVLKDNHLYAWGRAVRADAEITFLCPLSTDYLSGLVPGLGSVDFLAEAVETGALEQSGSSGPERQIRLKAAKKRIVAGESRKEPARAYLPPAAGFWDRELIWMSLLAAARWEAVGQTDTVVLAVRSRPSAVFRTILGNTPGLGQSLLPSLFLVVAVAFLAVEIISLIVGISLTRTITAAVHGLYEATLRVREADFSHRIQVRGGDQLAELGESFNSMTENLQRLLAVEKEKERLQSEIEIAREVQYQLYPRTVPELKTLSLTASCNPARMVSGDYYDYQPIGDSRIALAIGDVAGKGISAALLMATVESSVRTQLRHCLEVAAAAGGDGSMRELVSTSRLVAQLNQHLFAHTSPEKYATFCFGVYDEASGLFTYTNAGHLPPLLIRGGEPRQLEVNGMVVGAFPFAEYGESRVPLESGDLLVCYTDGVTEPENEYGEMFGEQRLIDVLVKHHDREPEEIVAAVTASVMQWTGSPDLQDDMTLLLARRA